MHLTLDLDRGGRTTIPIRGTVVLPELEVDTPELLVPLDCRGKGQSTVRVTNRGSGLLEVTLGGITGFTTQQLKVSPLRLTCLAGDRKTFVVSLDVPGLRPVEDLPKGTLFLRSNGGDQEIAVTAKLGGPYLSVTPASIDFGCVEQKPLPSRRLCIRNVGDDTLQGRVELRGEDPWIDTPEAEFQLRPKESKEIVLRPIPDYPVKLTVPTVTRRELTGVLRLTSNGGEARVPVRLVSKYHG
jgi:hypothetical protein